MRLVQLCAVASLLVACSEPTTSPEPVPAPETIEVLTAPPAAATVGDVLSDSIGFRVIDQNGEPIAGVRLLYTLTGGGTVSPSDPRTDANGIARISWTLGTIPGENTLEASVADSVRSPLLRVQASVGPPARMSIQPDTARINAISHKTEFRASTTDRFGNPITTAAGITWTTLNSEIATIDAEGQVEARANGSVQIVARVGEAVDTALVLVRQIAAGINASIQRDAATIGDTLRVQFAALDSAGFTMRVRDLTLSSSDTAVATIDSTGLVSVRGVGPVAIRAADGEARADVSFWGETRPEIAAGAYHTCALKARGAVYCWGGNDLGQTGAGTADDIRHTGKVATDVRFTAIAAAGHHVCALANLGEVYCWGWGQYGQLGNARMGGGANSSTPERVQTAEAFVAISTSQTHVCGLTRTGAAHCWGGNSRGQLGRGTNESASMPVPVAGSHSFVNITAGDNITCGSLETKALYCWGEIKGWAEPMLVRVPTPVVPRISFAQLNFFGGNGCGLAADGKAYCWGWNAHGQIGDGTFLDRLEPVRVLGGITFQSIQRGALHTCGVSSIRETFCWGANSEGQLGAGYVLYWISTPVRVLDARRFVQIAVGAYHTCGLTDTSNVYCWGDNDFGQLGDRTRVASSAPTPVQGLPAGR